MTYFLMAIAAYCIGFYLGRKERCAECMCCICKELD